MLKIVKWFQTNYIIILLLTKLKRCCTYFFTLINATWLSRGWRHTRFCVRTLLSFFIRFTLYLLYVRVNPFIGVFENWILNSIQFVAVLLRYIPLCLCLIGWVKVPLLFLDTRWSLRVIRFLVTEIQRMLIIRFHTRSRSNSFPVKIKSLL